MAVSVDTVYQRVLALANKEQRGYITPQEFNLLANHAQMSIFESYFYTKNQRNRTEPDRSPEVDETDIDELLNRKLAPFSEFLPVTSGHTFPVNVDVNGVNYPVFQYGKVMVGDEPCQKVSMFEAQRFKGSTRHMALTDNIAPFYTDNRVTGRDIVVYAGGSTTDNLVEETSGVTVECFRIPVDAQWAYVVVNGKALYNASARVDFELHISEEDTLVNTILDLAGIVINKPQLASYAATKVAADNASEKQ
tara:strand:+ start:25 stop:774 length:750 start_codon:yes stop_codon:yes gene_type:complete